MPPDPPRMVVPPALPQTWFVTSHNCDETLPPSSEIFCVRHWLPLYLLARCTFQELLEQGRWAVCKGLLTSCWPGPYTWNVIPTYFHYNVFQLRLFVALKTLLRKPLSAIRVGKSRMKCNLKLDYIFLGHMTSAISGTNSLIPRRPFLITFITKSYLRRETYLAYKVYTLDPRKRILI